MAPTRRAVLGASIAALASTAAGCLGETDAGGADGPTIEPLETPGAPDGTIPVVPEGTPTLLYFFATWCAPCDPQNEELAVVAEEVGNRVAMRGLSPEPDESLVADYWADSPAEFPAAIDDDQSVHETYGVTGYPSQVIVDEDGRGQWDHTGLVEADSILAALEAETDVQSIAKGHLTTDEG